MSKQKRFTHLDAISPIEIASKDTARGRFYTTPEGNVYPSITTILGHKEKPHLTNWRNSLGPVKASAEMARAAARGSAVHLMIERMLKNETDVTKDQQLEHVLEFNTLRLHLKNIDDILTQETPLWSDDLRAAGRVDCIANWCGVPSIIDFKTSTNSKTVDMIEDYWLQTTAYAIMCKERYDIDIEQAVIVMSVERGAVPLVFKQKIEPYIIPLIKRVCEFHAERNT